MGSPRPRPHPLRGEVLPSSSSSGGWDGLPPPSSSGGEVLPLSSSWGKGWAPVILILLGVKGSPRPHPHPGGGGLPLPSGGMGSPHTCFLGRGVGFPSLSSSRGVRAPLALVLVLGGKCSPRPRPPGGGMGSPRPRFLGKGECSPRPRPRGGGGVGWAPLTLVFRGGLPSPCTGVRAEAGALSLASISSVACEGHK